MGLGRQMPTTWLKEGHYESAQMTIALIDGPNAHSVDGALMDLGLAAWNFTIMYPVLTFQEALDASYEVG